MLPEVCRGTRLLRAGLLRPPLSLSRSGMTKCCHETAGKNGDAVSASCYDAPPDKACGLLLQQGGKLLELVESVEEIDVELG